MRTAVPTRLGAIVLAFATAGCGSSARLPISAGIGPKPELPSPEKSLIPVVNVVDAKGLA